MEKHKLGEMEERLAELIWDHAPLTTKTLIALCTDAFDWKRTTTYTMLKRLCDRELFLQADGQITVLLSREAFKSEQGMAFVKENFNDSLPSFIAAFSRKKKLSREEIEAIQQLIDAHQEVDE